MLKKALVTGSSSGIGKAIALDLAAKGFDVAFHYHKSVEACNQARQEAAKYGVKTVTSQADLRNPEQAEFLVKSAAE
ncbi:SDR family NAD(P)-dependent oxidoreductase, partial [Cylindrospermopsis raciborskii]|uniref:SDR family NAD(P)-dependent oxidoreductase n=1 Tax=Cylindrospermopsis raciborskii TaxID=77022 RepID=UPI0038D2046E